MRGRAVIQTAAGMPDLLNGSSRFARWARIDPKPTFELTNHSARKLTLTDYVKRRSCWPGGAARCRLAKDGNGFWLESFEARGTNVLLPDVERRQYPRLSSDISARGWLGAAILVIRQSQVVSSSRTIALTCRRQNAPMAAEIDRRITVLIGSEEQKHTLRRASDLRAVNFYVLLGEPGIGKTSTFKREAEAEGASRLTVRRLLTKHATPPDAVLFLDGLDEYRIDGQASDKVSLLAAELVERAPPRWRLACRSEDWRAEADIAQVQDTTSGEAIVVVQLQPLDEDEQEQILRSHGESDPARFIEQARAFNASAFCESPLSLGLLFKTVSTQGGVWPTTRQELFARSIERLAYEQNPEYKRNTRRSPVHEIVRAAGSAFLLMLASGASGFWRSNGEPPGAGDAHALLSAHDLGLGIDILQDMLDTALFKGEGELFEPMHRTIAEYLAAETLARAVVSRPGLAALPLSRALALIAGFDGRAPTELRGLFAWFAVHLMLLGDEPGARRVAEADPMTVLGYGDAASLRTRIRRIIFKNLADDDPYFRASDVGLTYVASLAGEDLAEDLKDALNDRASVDHRMLTALDALTLGTPVQSLRPLLREIVLDTTSPGWKRVRAFDAWNNGSGVEPGSVRSLFDEVALQPISIAREELRIKMASAFKTQDLTLDVIKSVVSDFQRCPEDDMTGRLSRLQQRLDQEPPLALFDVPATDWLPSAGERHHTVEIEGFLERTLTAVLRTKPNISAQQLVEYVRNASSSSFHQPREGTLKQIQKWLDEVPGRETELLDVLLSRDTVADKPYGAIFAFTTLTARNPSIGVVRLLLERSRTGPVESERRSSLVVATAIASRTMEKESYWEVYEELLKNPAEAALLENFTVHHRQDWELEHAAQHAEMLQRQLTDRSKNLATLPPLRADIESGKALRYLDWAARHYFDPDGRKPKVRASLDVVLALTDASLTNSFDLGWKQVALHWPTDIIVSQIGAAEATHHAVEGVLAALAGLLRILNMSEGIDTLSLPVGLAAVAFTSMHYARHDDERDRLEKWALDRVAQDTITGSAFLCVLWSTTLTAGGLHLNGLHALSKRETSKPVLAIALDSLLTTHPAMPPQTLRECLTFAATSIDPDRMKTIAAAALANSTVVEPQRSLWTIVKFAIDPECRYQPLLQQWSSRVPSELHDEGFSGNVLEAFVQRRPAASAWGASFVVHLFGSSCTPEDEHGSNRNSTVAHMSSSVRRAINRLTVDQSLLSRNFLSEMVADASLIGWQPVLRHARAEQASGKRDQEFKHPKPATVREALAGGPPVNAADLRAIVEEELRRMQREMHTEENQPWRFYWDLRSNTPLVENDCRDRLLLRLKDRLSNYRIAGAIPEARRGEQTRSDVLILSGAGKNLPVEAKLHSHRAIWTAASTQLQGYSADEGAERHGVYLVFWFGNVTTPTPARPDGAPGPNSAAEMEAMLIADLSPELRARTTVVVLDVADPNPTKTAKPRAKRGSKP